MASDGFTEDDQQRISDRALEQKVFGRRGLGFSATPQPIRPSQGLSFVKGANLGDEQPSASKDLGDKKKKEDLDYVRGSDQRGKSRSPEKRKDREKSRDYRDRSPERRNDGDRRKERSSYRKSRSRSRSIEKRRDSGRSKDYNRSRSRSVEKKRDSASVKNYRRGERWDRSRSQEKRSDRDRRRSSRSVSKDRKRQRSRSRSKAPKRERANRWDKRSDVKSGRSEKATPLPASNIAQQAKELNQTPAELIKAKMRHALNGVARVDGGLNTNTASVDRETTVRTSAGAGWETAGMADSAEFFSRDEYNAAGAKAGVAQTIQERNAMLSAIQDESATSLATSVPLRLQHIKAVAERQAAGVLEPEPSDQAMRVEIDHYDAMFAPSGTKERASSPSPEQPRSSIGKRALSQLKERIAETSGKSQAGEKPKPKREVDQKRKQSPSPPVERRRTRSGSPVGDRRQTEAQQPIYMTVNQGDTVEAQYTGNDKWYKAEVLQVIHHGYTIAKYKVYYPDYKNEETVPWQRIRLLEDDPRAPQERAPLPSQPSHIAHITDRERERSKSPVNSYSRTSSVPESSRERFAGDAPANASGKPSLSVGSSSTKAHVDHVHPDAAKVIGQGVGSWKERLAQRKAVESNVPAVTPISSFSSTTEASSLGEKPKPATNGARPAVSVKLATGNWRDRLTQRSK